MEFAPDVEQKVLKLKDVTDQEGNQVSAIIYDSNGIEVIAVPAQYIYLTNISEINDAPTTEIQENLAEAYGQIRNAGSWEEIIPPIEQICQSLGISSTELIVNWFFDLSVTGDYALYLEVDGNYIKCRFDTKISPTTPLIVLHNYSGSDWEVIPNDRVAINADGSVDIDFDSLSPIIILSNIYSEGPIAPEEPTEPDDGKDDDGGGTTMTDPNHLYVKVPSNGRLYAKVKISEAEDLLAGTWVFNDTLTPSSLDFSSFSFISGSSSFIGLSREYSRGSGFNPTVTNVLTFYFSYPVTDTSSYVAVCDTNLWLSSDYRTITITSKLSEVENGEDLLEWLSANAVKQSSISAQSSSNSDGRKYVKVPTGE